MVSNVNNPYPYDKTGYCVYCRTGQYKPHAATCRYREAVEQAQRPLDKTPKMDATAMGDPRKSEVF